MERTRPLIDRRRFMRIIAGGPAAVTIARGVTAAAAGAPIGDVEAGQTAASIENLLLAAYRQVATLPFLKSFARPVEGTFIAFITETVGQHTEHADAFNDAVRALAGRPQPDVDQAAKAALVDPALPGITSAADAVRFLAGIELVAAETYAALTPQVGDRTLRSTLAGVTGVECQHRAVLLTIAGLLEANATSLIAIPAKAASLPGLAGTAGFPDAFLSLDRARPPGEGVVR